MLPICVYQRLLAFSFRIQFFGVFVSWRFVFEFLLLLGRAIPKSVGRHCGERQDRQHGQFDQHRLVAVGPQPAKHRMPGVGASFGANGVHRLEGHEAVRKRRHREDEPRGEEEYVERVEGFSSRHVSL